jgi:hypothetical protein
MKLSLQFEPDIDGYSIIVMVHHKDTCILRSVYKNHYKLSTKAQSLQLLIDKLNDSCGLHRPLELFSDNVTSGGSSMAMTFTNGAFMYAHTIMSTDGQEVTTNNIYLLRPSELVQFYCELHKLLECVISIDKD